MDYDRKRILWRLISIEEAALWLDISKATAYRAIKNGTFPLPVIQIGGRQKVSLAALERLMNGETLSETTVFAPPPPRHRGPKPRSWRPSGPRRR